MLDIEQNRRAEKYSSGEMIRRVLWTLVQPFFRFSPRPCFGWRRFLLRSLGAKIGRNVHVYPSATIYLPWTLEAGDHLCAGTHDHTKSDFPLLRPPVVIGEQAWICADAFIGPGVTIGEGAIVGAGAVVMKDVKPWMIVVGNPARGIKTREIT